MEGLKTVALTKSFNKKLSILCGDCLPSDHDFPDNGDVPDLIVTDDLGCVARLSKRFRVVFFDDRPNREQLGNALDAGAVGYMADGTPDSVFNWALGIVAEGGCYVDPRTPPCRVASYKQMKLMKLTHRENEVLSLVSTGYNNSEIARLLYISEKTVKNHITSILRKLNLKNRTKLAVYALLERGERAE